MSIVSSAYASLFQSSLWLRVSLLSLFISACSSDQPEQSATTEVAAPQEKSTHSASHAHTKPMEKVDPLNRMEQVLSALPADHQARYEWRHPKETLLFFGIEPGMTVMETLPGKLGWYSKIIGAYLGKEGTLIGVNYNDDFWRHFGFMGPEQRAENRAVTQGWVKSMNEWITDDTPSTQGYTFKGIPETLNGTVDTVLFIRSIHNLSRFNDHGFLDEALQKSFAVLKPGGVLGVVQHQTESTKAVGGSRGYMNKQQVIETISAAGFQFIAETAINHNPNDVPTDQDIVWRLPPTLATSKDDQEAQKAFKAIGESNRMTLKFIKPTS